ALGEPDRLRRRHHARRVRGRRFRVAPGSRRDRRDPVRYRRARALASPELAGAPPEHQGVDVPDREDHGDGVLALRRLRAVLRGVRVARGPGSDRAVGALDEPLAAGLPADGAGDHLPARLAARVDRDHRDLLPDLHSLADPLQRRPDPLRHDGRRESSGRLPVAAGRDVGVLPEGRFAEARDPEPDLRGHDAVHGHRVYLARVREIDGQVQAWTFLDPEHALAQARAADELRMSGQPIGALHGVPVGLKDIIDTADMPTENGSVLHAGRTPSRDASVVSLLRAAGAVVMGKTVTTEFATRTPGKTRNPHNSGHTPGGSSSGSAAAVAAEMVPLALGSQTTGSTIRPASFCGVYGLKPTHGLIPRHGMFQLSRALDHVGLFARGIEDIALLLEELAGYDERDPDSRPRPRVPYRALA